MQKNQSREISENLKLFQKKAVRRFITAKSQFDLVKVPLVANRQPKNAEGDKQHPRLKNSKYLKGNKNK